jgi:hypothetical protein
MIQFEFTYCSICGLDEFECQHDPPVNPITVVYPEEVTEDVDRMAVRVKGIG